MMRGRRRSLRGVPSRTVEQKAATGDAAGDPTVSADPLGVLPFPVVGIGASAGGLEAFTRLLQALPVDTGMAFVLVQHLAPTRASMLADIMSRATSMPVMEVHDEPRVAVNHVYVIPPGRDMIISRGILQLFPREAAAGQHRPIDLFFKSLAADQGQQAIGVVLSGTATDGTLGLEEIKAAGGITFAQDTTAQQGGMPQSAIASGCVDVVLPPDEIARELARIARHPYISVPPAERDTEDVPNEDLSSILHLLRDATHVDFTQYKANTLSRRIERRMVLHKQERLSDYTRFIQKTAGELEALYQDILIGVTSFFRDPEVFEALKTTVFTRIVEDRARQEAVRIWVLGCSTGEEAYSIAMAFAECEEAAGTHVPVQIFASDLNTAAIDKARAGIYPTAIANDVSSERLRRFFVEADGGYRVSKPIRDVCLFTQHNVLSDPPFSRIDVVSCRNVLIYLEPALQQRILPLLHYALKPGGVLMLGGSETIGAFRDLFELQDAEHRLYTRKPGQARLGTQFPAGHGGFRREQGGTFGGGVGTAASEAVLKQADRFVLAQYAPPGIVIGSDMEILHVRGDVSSYLAPAEGRASLNLYKMVRPDVAIALRAALQRAHETRGVVREGGVRVQSNGRYRNVTLEVAPVQTSGGGESGFVILFVDGETSVSPPNIVSAPRKKTEQEPLASEVERLTHELAATREYLQSVIEQQEAAHEELQSSSEEVQSANEELQSINEELETSKEELQSSNEELSTVNDELQNRNAELGKLTNDLTNLVASIELSVLIVTRDLRIRRFSPMAEKTLPVSAPDIGRPIRELLFHFDIPDLDALLKEVIDSVRPAEREIRDRQGRWYALRIRPYQTLDNVIDGAVLVLVDIDTLKRAREYAESIVDTVRTPLVVLDGALRVVSANQAFYETFQVDAVETTRRSFYELGEGQWDVPQLRALLETVLPRHRVLADVEVAHDFPSIGRRVMLLNARPLTRAHGDHERILVAIEDITERQMLEEGLRSSVASLADADQHKNEFLAMLAHELRNPLAPIRNATRLLQMGVPDEERNRAATEMIDRQVSHMVRLVDDLLDVSRITLGTIVLRREEIDVATVVEQAVEATQDLCERTAQTLTVRLPPDAVYLDADPTRLTQIISNLLVNACKFSTGSGRVDLTVERDGMEAVIRVRDSGIGIAAEDLPNVFDMFMQVDTSRARSPSGLGIGLTLVKRLVELHGGTVQAESRGIGEGSEFVIRLPIVLPRTLKTERGAPRADSTSMPKRRVLVVDDNRDAAESLAMLLQLQGHDVAMAHGGIEAVDATASFRPDIVLLDLGLPGIDGYEVARQIRGTPLGKGALLVALTGWGRNEDRQRTASAGFDAHIVKPIDYEQLTQLIRSLPSAS
jgi:two-component system CheB/CheR fusion protein